MTSDWASGGGAGAVGGGSVRGGGRAAGARRTGADPGGAQMRMGARTRREDAIAAGRESEAGLADNQELVGRGEEEGDADLVKDAEAALTALEARAGEMELLSLLSGEVDGNDAYIEIHAGAGGTESQDWAEMLLRMYMRWAEKHGFKVSIVQYMAGEEAGAKSATIEIQGENAYGWATPESGVTRLVRLSPSQGLVMDVLPLSAGSAMGRCHSGWLSPPTWATISCWWAARCPGSYQYLGAVRVTSLSAL